MQSPPPKNKKVIIANWKMNLPPEGVDDYCQALKDNQCSNFIIAPPAPFIPIIKDYGFQSAGQNISTKESGAYTGEISAEILAKAGARFCLVGHSEQRQYHAHDNNDENLLQKIILLQKNHITPIYCIGETADERKKGEGKMIVEQQLEVFQEANIKDIYFIAYEPIWAIGTGNSATPADIETMHDHILSVMGDKNGGVIYGGSVNETNAQAILAIRNVAGLLIGGASLMSDKMKKILSFI